MPVRRRDADAEEDGVDPHEESRAFFTDARARLVREEARVAAKTTTARKWGSEKEMRGGDSRAASPSETVRVGINGFGRIGRLVFRAAEIDTPRVKVVAVNDPALSDVCYARYLLTHDSVFGRFGKSVEVADERTLCADGRPVAAFSERRLRVGGRPIAVSSESDPARVNWAAAGAEYVVDASGKFLRAEQLREHLTGGAHKVIVTAPTKDPNIPTYVVGVNEHRYVVDGAPDIVSNASCTTNCLAPLAKILDDAFGLRGGLMTTVHALTVSQPTVDAHHAKDWRRGRGAFNIVPTSSGAAEALGKVLPSLEGKLTGFALRVPVPDVSVVDLTVLLDRPASIDAVRAAVKHAAEGPMKGIVSYVDEPAVSSDFIGESASCVFDASACVALDQNFVKVLAWYDNEWGYACRVVDLVAHMARADMAAEEEALAPTKGKRTPGAAKTSPAG